MPDKDHTDVSRMLNSILDNENVCKRNKELMKDFRERIEADPDVSYQRQYKNLYTIKQLLIKYIDKPLDEATEQDITRWRNRIDRNDDISEWTKADRIVVLGKYFRTMHPHRVDRSDRIKRILDSKALKKPSNIENQKEVRALEPKEVLKMVDAADTLRDKAMILLHFEIGCRGGELLEPSISDVDLSKKYGQITVPTFKNGKDPRTVTIVQSIGLLQKWLETHPLQDEDGPLFVNIGTNKGSPVTLTRYNQVLKEAAKDAGIDDAEDITSHWLRHASATYRGNKSGFGIDTMMNMYGWSDPESAKPYLHGDEKTLKRKILREEGIEEEEAEDPFQLKECPRCDAEATPEANYCPQCSASLSREAAEEAKKVEEATQEVAEALVSEQVSRDELRELAAEAGE